MEEYFGQGYGYLLVLFRCTALVAVAPGLSSRTVPMRIRLGAAVLFAFAAWSGAGSVALAVPETLGRIVLDAGRESLLGICAGLGARFVLEAATSAGHMAGLSMGLGYGAQLSPTTGADSPALSQLLSMLTLTTAVLAGAHREAVLWLCRSLLTSPVGVGSSPAATAGAVSSAATPLVQLAQHALSQTLFGLGLGARISFPILVGVTSGHLLLGLTGRFAPQINLQSIGFTVALLAGGAALYLFAPTTIELVARHTILALSSQ